MDIDQAIRTRVSVKEYTERPVPPVVVGELLELAVLAPNHRMTEPVEFRVLGDGAKRAYAEALARRKAAKVDDPEAAQQVRDRVIGRTTRVPAMVAVVMRQDSDPEIREEDYATAFMTIQNLCLGAVGRGLGTHIKTGAVMGEPSLRRALEVQDGQRLVAIVFLGEPAELPERKPRTPADRRTRWLE